MAEDRIAVNTAQQITFFEHFDRMTGQSDMQDGTHAPLTNMNLAPVYDMLQMTYFP